MHNTDESERSSNDVEDHPITPAIPTRRRRPSYPDTPAAQHAIQTLWTWTDLPLKNESNTGRKTDALDATRLDTKSRTADRNSKPLSLMTKRPWSNMKGRRQQTPRER